MERPLLDVKEVLLGASEAPTAVGTVPSCHASLATAATVVTAAEAFVGWPPMLLRLLLLPFARTRERCVQAAACSACQPSSHVGRQGKWNILCGEPRTALHLGLRLALAGAWTEAWTEAWPRAWPRA